ncbi:hypothetical protein [Tardiphaga sp. vice278]|uniref:hypothetical protein n=1 Tax=Tardiphaga sp. vice278 TaxID=2592815 RepID=UPI0011624EC5|nr:hypothetical protein [Tardiphaga sp. vice278]QDM18182.1 hypothetical protein FNL53_21275 [Tardiphaga sp. vice278]
MLTNWTRLNPRNLLCAMLVTAVGAATLLASGEAVASPHRAGHVYLLRGLFNVFSLGMDQIASKLQAVGVTATVHNHTVWRGLADDMIAQYRSGNREPIILMGHSAGADATIDIARRLQESSVPVALIVNFDPVSPAAVPPNVKQIVNYYVPAGWGAAVAADKTFKGKLANVNESGAVNHFSIDKDDALQRQTLAKVLSVVGSSGGRPTRRANAAISAGPAQ